MLTVHARDFLIQINTSEDLEIVVGLPLFSFIYIYILLSKSVNFPSFVLLMLY